ncbi:LysR family transcriptional regulator [Roseinatronobacter alkalisoli]|uniref:LysR family transcriptional regulator n=1 Tax=Roseinatronobacter alkalisoli TaxID=3028235 RepID=A0ABT5TF94_9RHOB|nr:LysR family transcriptional regulator [Roseinatronobacter sp. HJB301]MDD7973796.1 LysR family transcriptional regulator [Roseinatronobacter sp. HJB301]
MLDRIIAARVFIETVERGSATAAAEALGMSRAMASRYLNAMEDWAGARLLHRSTRHMSLSPAGEGAMARCRELIEIAEGISGRNAETSMPQGEIRVAMPGVLADAVVLPMLPDFVARYPKVSIDLQVTDRLVDLVQDRIDVSLRITGVLDRAVIARRLGGVGSVLCAAPELLSRIGNPGVAGDLAGQPCVTYAQFGARTWTLSGPDGTETIDVTGPLQTNEAYLLLRAALEGVGIAMLPTFAAAPHLAKGNLVQVLPGWTPAELSLYALYASRRNLPAVNRAFIDFAVEKIGGSPVFR